MNIKLDLYGAFRQFGKNNIVLDIPIGSTVPELRAHLCDYLEKAGMIVEDQLIQASVFATDDKILSDADSIADFKTLCILPPVCGG